MELDSNTHVTNIRSSLIITQLLNLTFSMSGNLTSTLIDSTSSSNTGTEESVGSGSISVPQSSDQTHIGLKSNGRNGRRDNSEPEMLEMFNRYFATVIDPVVIAIGIVGNALLALVFMITPLRMQPLSHVLSGLGVVDLIYMLSYMLMYLTKTGANVYEVPGACHILTFILVLTKCVEAWYIFISHLDRLKSHTNTRSELLRLRVFNTKFAIIMIAILVAAPLLHTLWSMETLKIGATTYCVPMRETISIHLIMRKMEVIATVLLPLLLIAGVDVMLVIKFLSFLVFKKDTLQTDNIENNLNCVSTSSHGNKNTMQLQEEDFSQEESSNKSIEDQHSTDGNVLSPTFQNAYHLMKEDRTWNNYNSDVDSLQYNSEDEVVCTDKSKCMGVPKNISISTTSLDDNSIQLSTPLSEPFHFFNRELNNCLPLVEVVKLNCSEPDLSTIEAEKKSKYVLDIYKIGAEQNQTDFTSSLEIITASNSKNNSLDKQYNIMSSSLNSPNKYKHSTVVESNIYNTCNSDHVQISKCIINSGSYRDALSSQQFKNNSSNMSISARNQVTREDLVFPNDTTECTLTIVLLGVIFAATILPSTYTHAVRLFLESPGTRPSAHAMQLAILFESFVKINAVYKIFMYTLVMPSFRSAIMWLLTHWIPNKITRIYSLCLWGPGVDKNDPIYV